MKVLSMKFIYTLFFFLSIYTPVLGEESESILKLRQMVKDALATVEPIVFKKDVGPIVVPVPTPAPTQCPDCKGTGFITHGDGHKTPCPKWPGCTKKTGEVSKTIKSEVPKTIVKVETPRVKVEINSSPIVKSSPEVKTSPIVKSETVVKSEIIKSVPLNAYIKMYSIPLCIPCAAWKRNMLGNLVKNGWTVEVDDTGSKYSRFPTFEVYINGNKEVVNGYLTSEQLQTIKEKYRNL